MIIKLDDGRELRMAIAVQTTAGKPLWENPPTREGRRMIAKAVAASWAEWAEGDMSFDEYMRRGNYPTWTLLNQALQK